MIYLLCIITICFGFVFYAQADDEFNLDEITIELVEEGEEIAHQIDIPFLDDTRVTIKQGHGREGVTEMNSEHLNETREDGDSRQIQESDEEEPKHAESARGDDDSQDFLELIEDEADAIESMTEAEQEEAMDLADEMLQQSQEEAGDVEDELEQQNIEIGVEQREQEALVDELEKYKEEEDDDGVITVYDRLGQREQEVPEMGSEMGGVERVEDMELEENAVEGLRDH